MSRYMIIGTLLQCIFYNLILADNSSAQVKSLEEVYIDIHVNGNVVDAFQEIEKRTEFKFTYNKTKLDTRKKVVLHARHKSLMELLFALSQQTNFKFKRINNIISVTELKNSKRGVIRVLQSRTITGQVTTNETPEGMPGVNVILKGTSTGTVTDINGKYSIEVSSDNAVLVFSSVGYTQKEVNVGNQSVIDVKLVADVTSLEEIVVVGYGTQEKKDVTGSVSSLDNKDFNPGVVVSPEQLMQGKMPGVEIIQNSGQPGAASTVRVRGQTSISAGNDPLYVVDGVPLQFTSANNFVSNMQGSSPFSSQPTNPLNILNPADIESIDVLKDASATAIYGSRGANGVIIITTKSKNMGSNLTYDTYVGISKVRKTLPFLSAEQYRNFAEGNNLSYPDEGANTNWQEEVFRTALSHNHNIAFGGGSESSGYRASLGYTSQEGILLSSKLQKYTGRFNGHHSAIDDKMRINVNLTYGNVMEDNTPISSNINNEGGNILKDALRWAPTLPVRNEDGSYYQLGELRINPVSWKEVDDERNTDRFLGNADAEYDLLESLTFKVNVGYTDESIQRFTNEPDTHPSGANEGGRASINKLNNYSYLLETTLNFNKNIGDNSNLNILGGYSFQRFVSEYTFTEANQFVSSATKWNLIQSGNILANTSHKTANRLASVFGRLNYKLLNRYLLTFSLRNDGSSRFGENNRWGLFPSGAIAWNISEENFMDNNSFNSLKLRLGYGITGNQEIPNNLYRQQLSISGSSVYVLGGEAIPSVLPTNYANPDLQWEQTSQLNIGIDFGLFNNRLTGSVDYYDKQTTNLLLEFSTVSPSVVESQWANVGEIQNRGFEVFLKGTIINNNDFTWDANIVYSRNRNEVLSLSNDQFSRESIRTAPLSGVITPKDFSQIIRPGDPIGTFYGRKFIGFDEDGMEMYLDEDGEPGADDVVIGNAQPDFTFGFTNNFTWNNFDASITLRGVVGNDILNNTAGEFSYPNSAPGVNILESALDSEVSHDVTPQFSSRWIEDGSYMRLDNINIGYNFNIGNSSVLKRARIYVTGQNLFVITGYSGFDPEVRTNTNAGGTAPIGIDYLVYPRPRVFQIGGSFSF